MKLKGISKLEQHAEKLFLTLIAIAFLLVLSWQVLKGGSTLEVKNTQDVSIDQAFERIVAEAKTREGQVTDPQPDARVPTTAPNLVAGFDSRLEEVSTPLPPLEIALGRTGGEVEIGSIPDDPLIVELPRGFAPARPIAHAFGGTIDPVEPVVHADLAPFLPEEQPYDKFAVSVEASFDATALIDMLKRDPDGPQGEAQPIPNLWWKKQIQILDVEIWRQEVDSGGSPLGEPELLPPPPGRLSLRSELGAVAELPQLIAMSKVADQKKSHLTRPAYYHMIAGPDWIPPSLTVENPEGQTEVERKKAEYRRIVERIRRLERQLDDFRNRQASRSILERTDVFAQVGRGGPGGRGGGAGNRGRDSEDAARERKDAAEQRFINQITDLEERQALLETQLEELGVDPADLEKDDRIETVLNEPIGRLQDGGTFRIWTHDVSVQPGRTYRYQVRLAIPNPLFGYAQNLAPQSKPLAAEPVMYSDASPWSDPVTIDADTYILVTKAGERRNLNDGREVGYATADLYHFFFGYWRKTSAEIKPGDAISGGIDLEPLGLALWNVSVNEGNVGQITEEPLTGMHSFNVNDWYLLNVAPTQDGLGGRGDVSYVAILYGPEGALTTRRATEDLRSTRRDRLEDSVEEGLSASAVAPDPAAVQAGAGMDEEATATTRRRQQQQDSTESNRNRNRNLGGRGR